MMAGTFPAEYRGDAFVTFHGSWNRGARTGYKVVRLLFQGWQADRRIRGFHDRLRRFPTRRYGAGPSGLRSRAMARCS